MELREMHDHVLGFVRHMYEKNGDPDFDVHAMAHLQAGEEVMILMLEGGNPLDSLSTLLNSPPPTLPEEVRAKLAAVEKLSFCTAIWRREALPDGTSGERIGEGVMVITESITERIGTILEVKRDPLPVLYDMADSEVPESMHPRVPLLYQAKPTEH